MGAAQRFLELRLHKKPGIDSLLPDPLRTNKGDEDSPKEYLTHAQRGILYRHLVASVAGQWRMACAASSLARVDDEEVLNDAKLHHRLHEPMQALRDVPMPLMRWLLHVVRLSAEPVSRLGSAERPPMSDLTVEALEHLMNEASKHGADEDEQAALDQGLADLRDSREHLGRRIGLAYTFVLLLAVSDEASAGMGVRVQSPDPEEKTSKKPDALLIQAAAKLITRTLAHDQQKPASCVAEF